jgi:ferric-dicitrate binding protein FerR (iron transport regulator)
VRERGPKIVRRARFMRKARPIAAIALVVAAVLLLLPREEPKQELAPVVDRRTCAGWSPAASLDLGPRGVAIGNAEITSSDPCTTVLALERGRLIVHARDLGGGELFVESGSDRVVVRGTLFAVEREGELLSVEVAEGRVELGDASIAAGERAEKLRGSIARTPLSDAKRESMMIAVGLIAEKVEPAIEPEIELERQRPRSKKKKPAPAPPREESADELMAKAHEARKKGDLAAARDLFQRAGRELESAWLSLANMELEASRPEAAIEALDRRGRRFGEGSLAVEATWYRVRALEANGDQAGAAVEAKRLVERWPGSPYAARAKKWLEKR